jgi:dTDP-4-dehydrorhamnose reductase
LVADVAPDVIVNAAAYTAVDRAEQDEALAMTVNADAVGELARAAKLRGALFVHYSTEYVFDGTKTTAYSERDEPNPLNAYGRSKLAGEHATEAAGGDSLVFRTSWVFSHRGKNFLRTIMRLATQHDTLRVVADQHGAPTPARMIADITAHAVRDAMRERRGGRFESGLFHLTAGGQTSWHGFASAIVDAARDALPAGSLRAHTVSAIASADYPTQAKRPANSVLDNAKLEQRFGLSRESWQKGMRSVLDELFESAAAVDILPSRQLESAARAKGEKN